MREQYPASDFDEWAASYDQSVSSGSGFPFDGYQQVLDTIFEQASVSGPLSVLDLGAGTGNLSALFLRRNCKIWCLDFSTEMLVRAGAKLPGAFLGHCNILRDWPPAFQRRFDRIVSAYTFHHFVLKEKVDLVKRMLSGHLEPHGLIVIGDIAFQNAQEQDAMRRYLGDDWEQEEYWLADEDLAALSADGINASFTKISSCAGVFKITPTDYSSRTTSTSST